MVTLSCPSTVTVHLVPQYPLVSTRYLRAWIMCHDSSYQHGFTENLWVYMIIGFIYNSFFHIRSISRKGTVGAKTINMQKSVQKELSTALQQQQWHHGINWKFSVISVKRKNSNSEYRTWLYCCTDGISAVKMYFMLALHLHLNLNSRGNSTPLSG